MLKEMITKVKSEVESEKQERGNNQEVLFGLLESTIAKLNKQATI